jgi:hypothetical protein
MRKILNMLFTLATAGSLSGCITEFNLKVDVNPSRLLVVEGIITDNETTNRLSRSIGLYEKDLVATAVYGAQVWVESEAGDRFDAAETTPGTYIASTGVLDTAVRYRLGISWSGQEYASDWRHPAVTPEIENMEFYQREQGDMIDVRLDVTGRPDGLRNYLWRYEETWEIVAPVMATAYYGREGDSRMYSVGAYLASLSDTDPDNDIKIFSNAEPPYFYCWRYNRSKELLIASTDQLTENTLRDHVIYRIAPDSDRFSFLYHTKIVQYAIADDAYHYFSNLKKNSDETGSIFAPIPSEMEGNIVCVSSPDTPVIGFVEVSKGAGREVWLDSNPYYEPPFNDCKNFDSHTGILEAGKSLYDYYLVFYTDFGEGFISESYSTIDCIDCRRSGGSKVRPSWWPNNHF